MNLRLLLLSECNRTCKGCCNKDFDLESLPVCNSFTGYEMVILTGGEPLLKPWLIINTAVAVRAENPTAKIVLYTARSVDPALFVSLLENHLDGITLTLHTRKDVASFITLNNLIKSMPSLAGKSLRLNVFRGINLGDTDLSQWKVKNEIQWIKECPLPSDEVFMRRYSSIQNVPAKLVAAPVRKVFQIIPDKALQAA